MSMSSRERKQIMRTLERSRQRRAVVPISAQDAEDERAEAELQHIVPRPNPPDDYVDPLPRE